MLPDLFVQAKSAPLAMAAALAAAAGLVSFPHCGLMCGPLLGIFRDNAGLYQAGRLAGYTTLGALFGAAGASVDKVGVLFDVQGLSLWVIVTFAVIVVVAWAVRPSLAPNVFPRIITRVRSALSRPASTFVAGAASSLLPCGVLYPLWAVSAASGSTISGAVVSLSFAAATIPALFVGQKIAAAIGRRFGTPVLRYGAAVVLLAGLALLFWQRTAVFSAHIAGSDNQCHNPQPTGR